ncbi:phosphoglycerate kinase [Candidatus Parcubacteria bacterium]|jgi:phosphoglycerate kinase|nr:MAG: phosphoglycerate kinase [Candidatus Parcubacteria bacterium]
MNFKSLKTLAVNGKQVIVRVDFNVPIKDGRVIDPSRIQAALPTINFLCEQKCRIILLTHLGKPKATHDPACSLQPVFEYLAAILPGVKFAPIVPGTAEAITRSQEVRPGDILLFDNLRFHTGESENDLDFAKNLAALGEIYINEAFSVCHRKAASVSTLPTLLPSAAGFQLQKEVEFLQKIMEKPQRPFIGIIGGAKISTKLPVIRALLEKVDYLLLGGALANTILKAQGIAVGKSLIEESMVSEVKDLNLVTNKLRVPIDVVMAPSVEPDALSQTVAVANVPDEQRILDIGPETLELYKMILQTAKTVVWNGPMGYFELPQFEQGTKQLAEIIAGLNAETVAGGGETLEAINQLKLNDKFTFLSTGGGAMLAFLEGKPLPGLEPLTIE